MKACPFCGAGEMRLDENTMWNGGLRPDTLVSVTLRHWCTKTPNSLGQYVEIRAKTRAAAEMLWDTRST